MAAVLFCLIWHMLGIEPSFCDYNKYKLYRTQMYNEIVESAKNIVEYCFYRLLRFYFYSTYWTHFIGVWPNISD